MNDRNIDALYDRQLSYIKDYLYRSLEVLRNYVLAESVSLNAREGNDTLFNSPYLVCRVITFIEDIAIIHKEPSRIFDMELWRLPREPQSERNLSCVMRYDVWCHCQNETAETVPIFNKPSNKDRSASYSDRYKQVGSTTS